MRQILDAVPAAALLASLTLAPLALAETTEPAPVVVPPSEAWVGDDGSWSSFSLSVGNPAQVVQVLVSTAWSNSMVILDTVCSGGESSPCATQRGGIFSPNSSKTFQDRGLFNLYPELNFTTGQDAAEWGLDTISFGLDNSGPTLNDQVVAATQTDDYYIGMLGIDPQATNWTSNFQNNSPSLFKTLQTQNLIPSLTYSYTAGAPYQFKKVLGSLVFGGYDASRVQTNEQTFTFATDVTRDLVVGIQSIQATFSSGENKELLSSGGVLAFVDSTDPYIVLPLEVCSEFESAFGIQWNPGAGHDGLYTIDDAQHNGLVASNPNISFTLGNSEDGGETITITLPYAAFDLSAQYPLVNSTTRYFPLLRAANDSQITLGRTFLQEAMLVADYERGNFSIWQCVWVEDAQEQINTIHSISYVDAQNANSSAAATQAQSNRSLTIGLGVGVGAGVPILLALLLAFARWKHLWPFHQRGPPVPPKSPGNPELDSKLVPFPSPEALYLQKKGFAQVHDGIAMGSMGYRPELAASQHVDGQKVELPSAMPTEHYAPRKTELPADGVYRPDYSALRGFSNASVTASEVEGSSAFKELPGSTVPSDYLHSSQSGSIGGSRQRSGSTSRTNSRHSAATTAVGSVRGTTSPSRNPSTRGGSAVASQRTSTAGISSPLSSMTPGEGSEDETTAAHMFVNAASETNPDRLFRSLN